MVGNNNLLQLNVKVIFIISLQTFPETKERYLNKYKTILLRFLLTFQKVFKLHLDVDWPFCSLSFMETVSLPVWHQGCAKKHFCSSQSSIIAKTVQVGSTRKKLADHTSSPGKILPNNAQKKNIQLFTKNIYNKCSDTSIFELLNLYYFSLYCYLQCLRHVLWQSALLLNFSIKTHQKNLIDSEYFQ